jgi:hypothetical protein
MTPTALNSRNIKDCVPELQLMHSWVISEWDKRYPLAPNPTLVQTYRSPDIQAVFYMQGRLTLNTVNEARIKLGLSQLQPKENVIITKKQFGGKHNEYPSKAVDYLFTEGKRILNDKESKPWYIKLNALIKEKFPNVVWGADWNNNGSIGDEKFIDMPHFQV